MPKKHSDDDIREVMLDAHRDSYEFWSRLIRSTSDRDVIRSLYRYREGFDHAIINIAKKLDIDLARKEQREEKPRARGEVHRGWAVKEGEAPTCSQCNTILFKIGKNVWNCPQCKVNYLIRDE